MALSSDAKGGDAFRSMPSAFVGDSVVETTRNQKEPSEPP